MHFFFELQECSVCVNEGWGSQYFIRIRRVYCVLYHFIWSTVKNLGGWGVNSEIARKTHQFSTVLVMHQIYLY